MAINGHGGDDSCDANCWWEQYMAILINNVKQLFGENSTLCDALVGDGDNKLEANLLFKQTFEPCGTMILRV
jgi:hypothetical protein